MKTITLDLATAKMLSEALSQYVENNESAMANFDDPDLPAGMLANHLLACEVLEQADTVLAGAGL